MTLVSGKDLERFRFWSLMNIRIVNKIFNSPCQPRLSGAWPHLNLQLLISIVQVGRVDHESFKFLHQYVFNLYSRRRLSYLGKILVLLLLVRHESELDR